MPAIDDHEARSSALEASHADYRAVLATANALGAKQRENSLRLTSVDARLTGVETQLAEIKDLIIDRRNG